MNLINQVRGIIGLNSHIILENRSVNEVVNLINAKSSETGTKCSSFLIHTMKYCNNIPGVDKLFILANALEINPNEFIQSREDQLVDKFLSLVAEKRPDILNILRGEGYNI